MLARILCVLAVLALMAAAPGGTALAFDPADNDAVYLGFGSANIQVRDSDDLLSGSNVFGGLRLGLISTLFLELGYGAVEYADSVLVNGVTKDITFRTTGAHAGLGLLIPVRAVHLGLKAQRSLNNRWAEEIVDFATQTTDSNRSGDIDFDSYYAFVQLGKRGMFELGLRRDQIRSTDSLLTNSFGPYLAVNILLR